ncbi:MAG: molecular chaperone TorD family protein [Deferribacterota bacterium]|nr:molecular chaperone TorD family protein [Deferribacterota bacterium]
MNFIEINSGREVVYNFLSRSLIDCPDKQYLKMFEELCTYLVEIGNNKNVDHIKVKKIFLNLKREINTNIDKNNIIIRLSKEYTNLFCLGSYSIAPYESVYLSVSRILKQKPWEEVSRVFNENKFFTKKNANLPEDHIAHELLFMSFLSYKAKEASKKSDIDELEVIYYKQISFLEKHLFRWTGDLCNDILRKILYGDSFYAGIASFIKGYLDMDYGFLKKVVV